MNVLSASDVHSALDWATLDSALTAAFAVGAESSVQVPLRHAHTLGTDGSLLLMPAWDRDAIGLKVVTVLSSAAAFGAATVGATYLLIDARSGHVHALLDGDALTLRRTAAVSAIAARYLARANSATLLMVGTGRLAPWMVRAHCALRPVPLRVQVWGRDGTRAARMASALCDEGLAVEVIDDLREAVPHADIICCATTSRVPLIHGEWLGAGVHVDLVGGFTREMREVDDAAMARSRIVVDSYDALSEAGDLIVPMEQGVITRARIVADLGEVVRGDIVGRTSDEAITVFKSVGTARADLAAAKAAMVKHANSIDNRSQTVEAGPI